MVSRAASRAWLLLAAAVLMCCATSAEAWVHHDWAKKDRGASSGAPTQTAPPQATPAPMQAPPAKAPASQPPSGSAVLPESRPAQLRACPAPRPRNASAPPRPPAPCDKSVADAVAADSNLATLSAALKAAGLTGALSDTGAVLTVFAPTNAAFEALAKKKGLSSAQGLLADTAALADILKYHVVPGRAVDACDLDTTLTLPTLQGNNLFLSVILPPGQLSVAGIGSTASVVKADVRVCKSVVQVIDTVLLPK